MLDRRSFLIGSVAASLTPFIKGCQSAPLWDKDAYQKQSQSHVAILPAKNYEIALKDIMIRGIRLFNLSLRGKRVVLKPNLVEYDPAGVINTHPAVISGAIEAFKMLGAREVIVAEGPGHRRDNEYLLTASGLLPVLRDHKAPYVDLNYDDTRPLKLRSHFTNLGHLYLPETIAKADLLVSMPKLKTHHWAGVTLSMKNMFGLVPGAVYGWPKNILHWSGIGESILDINGSLPIPRFAIVDGIIGMEGNGPIQGKPKHSGVLILGGDLAAVDATAARLMKIDPWKINYLERAGHFLGNIEEEKILQIAESLEPLKQDFEVIQSFAHAKTLTG
ncbi:MAG: DUF362 domain-containing protein [Deltaproteobacteria bacterium]|nr:MAG: DUF362 domain-containing protein [Deltaproteobacteria bacterium]